MSQQLEEMKFYTNWRGGTNNVAHCQLVNLNISSMPVAHGSSLNGMDQAVKNAWRNHRRKQKVTDIMKREEIVWTGGCPS